MSSLLRFDDEKARQAEKQYHSPEVVEQRERLRRILALRPGESVLDVGCGPGLQSAEMAAVVGPEGRVVGVDISETMLAMAQARSAGLPWVELTRADALALPFAEGVFDAAVATQVYEYVADVDGALSELFRVMRPGGRVVILDTDWDSLVLITSDRARARRILDVWDEHLTDPRLPETLGPRLKRAGFEVVGHHVIPFLNLECHELTYSYGLIHFITDFVATSRPDMASDVRDWAEELARLAEEGSFFFSLNRYIVHARKSPAHLGGSSRLAPRV